MKEIPSKCHQRRVREQHEDGRPVPTDFSDAHVQEIPYEWAKEFILKYEWLGNMGTTVRTFGLFFGEIKPENMAAVECFGHPGSEEIKNVCGKEHADKVYWLARGACAHWAPPRSASSFLINAACKEMGKPWKTRDGKDMPAKFIFLATADTDAGEIGTVYQASNWVYLGLAMPDRMFLQDGQPPERAKSYRVLVKSILRNRTDRVEQPDPDGRRYFLIDGKKYYCGDITDGGERIVGSEKYPFRLRLEYGTTMREAEKKRFAEVLAMGWKEIKGNRKHLYCGIYGDRRQKRDFLAALKKNKLKGKDAPAYPKRGSVEGNAVGTTNGDEVRSLGAAPSHS